MNHSFLVLLPAGIGDAVMIGASVIDQLVKNDPDAYGKIDIACNDLQAELFAYDPRIHSIIHVTASIFAAPAARTWIRGGFLNAESLALLHKINSRRYQAVYPGSTTPFFYKRIHSPIIKMASLNVVKDLLSTRKHAEIPYGNIPRKIINTHFGNKLPEPGTGEAIPLYVSSQAIQKAQANVRSMIAQAGIPEARGQLLVVAADTSSVITRPPTHLLSTSIADALISSPVLVVCILPGYTDPNTATDLYQELWPHFGPRVCLLPSEPKLPLPELTMLIDQANVFVTGDTGVMHLAVAHKKVREGDNEYAPMSRVKVIALFGGTNPRLFGYAQQSVIVGKGRKEQTWIVPGMLKEAYFRKRRAWFDHISSQQVTEAIVSQLEIVSRGYPPKTDRIIEEGITGQYL